MIAILTAASLGLFILVVLIDLRRISDYDGELPDWERG